MRGNAALRVVHERPRTRQPGKHFLRDRQVVGAEIGPVIEDRLGALGRLGVGDRGADRGVEHLLAEALLQRDERLARVHGAHIGEVQQHTEQLEVRVEAVPRELDHLHRLLDALQREVLGLGGHERAVGGDQRVDRQQAERGRAVDQDQLVVAGGLGQRAAQRQLAAHLRAEHQLGLREAQVGGDQVVVDRLAGRGSSGQHVGDRRLDFGRQVEVVRQVALRVEVHRERLHAARRNASASVRTAVVLPVPPFWESTAIVVAAVRDAS